MNRAERRALYPLAERALGRRLRPNDLTDEAVREFVYRLPRSALGGDGFEARRLWREIVLGSAISQVRVPEGLPHAGELAL